MPIVIKADASALWTGVGELFSANKVFCDTQVAGVRASSCFLASAAHSTSQALSLIESECSAVPPQSSKALVELVLGQEIALTEHDHFFRLFSLAQRLQWRSCMDLCKDVIANSKHETLPILLKLSSTQGQSLLSYIRAHPLQLPGDALIKVRKAESTDGLTEAQKNSKGDSCSAESVSGEVGGTSLTTDSKESSESGSLQTGRQCFHNIRVHRAVLAAACDYVRGLWGGGFSESVSPSEQVELELQETDIGSLKALLAVVYGGETELPSIDEVVHLYRFADRWQCGSVKSAALVQILTHLTPEKAVSILDGVSPLPSELLRASADTLTQKLPATLPFTAAMHLLDACVEIKGHAQLLRMARDRVLTDLADYKEGSTWALKFLNNVSLINTANHEAVSVARAWSAKTVDQFQKEEAWLRVRPEAMICLLEEVSRQARIESIDVKHILRWANEHCRADRTEEIQLIILVFASAFKEKTVDFQALMCGVLEATATGDDAPAIICAILNVISATKELASPPPNAQSVDEQSADPGAGEPPIVEDDACGQNAKRRRTSSWMIGQFSVGVMASAREPLRDALRKWLSVDGRFGKLCNSTSWQELLPAALLEAMQLAPSEVQEADSAIVRWVRSARVEVVFDAFALSSPAADPVMMALYSAARERFSAIAGGGHQEDIAKAVEAERVATRAAAAADIETMRNACDQRIADLEKQLAEARRDRDSAAECHQAALQAARSHIEKAVEEALGAVIIDTKDPA